MKDYRNIDRYLRYLTDDIYPQPPDAGHTQWAREVFDRWSDRWKSFSKVLDVGCGEAFVQPWFNEKNIWYRGICLGEDFRMANLAHRNVFWVDFHFLEMFEDNSFDLIFSRHSLEHSPMPLIALMEWNRVCSKQLCLVLPNPDYWGWVGRNHYSVMNDNQARFLLDRAGWDILDHEITQHELRYLCGKRIGK